MIQKYIVEFFGGFHYAVRQKRGFTLIELLVVIAILGLLAAVVVINLNPAANISQARDARRIADMSSLKDAMELYAFNAPGGGYPVAVTMDALKTALVPNYLAAIPADPTNSGTNIYRVCSAATGFAISAKLETDKYAHTSGTQLPCDPAGGAAPSCPAATGTIGYYCTSGKK